MVYQFLFDVFLFNTMFSELQYWGIGITVLTFILDIYLTIRSPETLEVANEKKDREQDSLTELTPMANIPISQSQSQRAPRISSVGEPLIIKPERDMSLSLLGGSTAHATTNADEAATENSANCSSHSTSVFDVGTSGETMELRKKIKKNNNKDGISHLSNENSPQQESQVSLEPPNIYQRRQNGRRTSQNVSGRYKSKVYKFEDHD